VIRRIDKVTANAVYLAAATILTSLVGLLFWGVAARSNERHTLAFGSAYAEISALTLLSIISQFNLTNIFVRFLPAAGARGTYFVRRGYIGVTTAALILGSIYVVTPLSSKIVPGGVFAAVVFIVAVALFALFALQDSVLTALRITHWVPIENTSFSLAKLGLLSLFIGVLPLRSAIVLAWILPVIVAVILVNWLIFARALPRHAQTGAGSLPPRRQLAKFVAAEYLTTLSAVASAGVLPLVVIWKAGASGEAYFAVPWLVAATIMNVFWNINASYTVESVAANAHSARKLRRTLELWIGLVVVSLVACTLLGPTILGLLGPAYRRHGGPVLQLIGLSAPFSMVTIIYQAYAWLDRRVWVLLANAVARAVVLIGLSIGLLSVDGIVGVGWAYLGAQAGAALVMIPGVWRQTRRILTSPAPIPLGRREDDEPDPLPPPAAGQPPLEAASRWPRTRS
jgi:O-antigen/teichoic acid export membrane protein